MLQSNELKSNQAKEQMIGIIKTEIETIADSLMPTN